MDKVTFQKILAKEIDALPVQIRRRIANVAIVVEDVADDDVLDLAGVDDPMDLYGLYEGIPLTERTQDYGLVLPDKISLYREPILARCRTVEEVRCQIRETLRHELAHYFGIDDDRLEEIGAY